MDLEITPLSGDPPLTIQCVASPPPSEHGYTFVWEFGNNDTRTGQVTNYQYSNPGTYTITCTATEGGNTGIIHYDTAEVIVNEIIPVPTTADIYRCQNQWDVEAPGIRKTIDYANLKVFGNNSNLIGTFPLKRLITNDHKLWEERVQEAYLLPGNKVYVFTKYVELDLDPSMGEYETGIEATWSHGGFDNSEKYYDVDQSIYDSKGYGTYTAYIIEGSNIELDTFQVIRSVEMSDVSWNVGNVIDAKVPGTSCGLIKLRSWDWEEKTYTEQIDRVYVKNVDNHFHWLIFLKMTIGNKECFNWHNGIGSWFYNDTYGSIHEEFEPAYGSASL